ncbi:MAG: threonine--tRNA ligase, partial [Clostridia bacterium]|nr:threonine--tRNA ligase [Clostridia bacterium]
MFEVKFADKTLQFDSPITAYDAAREAELISREVIAAKVNGTVCDLTTLIEADASVELLTFADDEGAHVFRHTASHVLAAAVKRLYPDAKLTIGPAIDNGFYYDFDSDVAFTPEILEKIEAEMKKVIKENPKLEKYTLPRAEALEFMKDEPYKVELINDLPEDAVISFYKMGDFTDLCAGPHLFSAGAIKAFKLTSCTGAYWRGDASRKMLQRIYGTAFPAKDALKAYLEQVEEARKRDHNKLGRELELFTTV